MTRCFIVIRDLYLLIFTKPNFKFLIKFCKKILIYKHNNCLNIEIFCSIVHYF